MLIFLYSTWYARKYQTESGISVVEFPCMLFAFLILSLLPVRTCKSPQNHFRVLNFSVPLLLVGLLPIKLTNPKSIPWKKTSSTKASWVFMFKLGGVDSVDTSLVQNEMVLPCWHQEPEDVVDAALVYDREVMATAGK